MSLPDENKRALKMSHRFLTSLLGYNKQTFRNMSAMEFDYWLDEVSNCLRHYPFDIQLDELYSDQVCKECGQCVEWHKEGCGNQ